MRPATLFLTGGAFFVELLAIAWFADAALAASLSPDGDPPIQTIEAPASELILIGGAGAGAAPRAAGTGPFRDRFELSGSDPEGDNPSALVFTPDGSRFVVAYRDTWNLVVYDAATRAVVSTISLSGGPQDVAITPDGTKAVTANLFENNVSIVDLATAAEIATIPVGTQPGVVRISPAFDVAVVGNTVDGTLSVINLTLESESGRIGGVAFVSTVSFAPEPGVWTASFSGFEFYGPDDLIVPDFFGDQLAFVNLTGGIVNTVPVSDAPREIAVSPDGSVAVVSHTGSESVISVVQPVTQTVLQTISTIDAPRGPIAINPSGTKAAFAVLNAARIANLTTGLVSLPLDTASFSQIYTTADGQHALTIGFRGSLLDYATETLVRDLNNVVSTAVGGVSPTDARGAMAATTFGENIVVVNTNGAFGFLEAVIASGPPPEGDNARMAALSPDGRFGVVTNILSDNASVFDFGPPALSRASGPFESAEAIVPVGDRPAEIAFTPDSERAVVANLDSNFLSVIDVAAATARRSGSPVTNVTISRRAGEVEISPDGRYAYAAVVADGDGVWRVNLETSAVEGAKLLTGNMGGVGYLFSQSSGMTLSHDGATLVTCNSFDDTISIIDTATWIVIATVPVGDFPTRAIFSADDLTIFVAAKNSDAIAIVTNAGALSTLAGLVLVGDQPFEMVLSPDGLTLYVLNFGDPSVGVVSVASATQTTTYPLSNFPAGIAYDADGPHLIVPNGTWSLAIGPGPLLGFNMAGAISVLDPLSGASVQEIDLERPPADLAYRPAHRLGVVPSPFALPGRLVSGPTRLGTTLPPAGEGVTIFATEFVAVNEPAPAPAVSSLVVGPNPTSGGAVVSFSLTGPTRVALGVYDVAGRLVSRLADDAFGAGSHEVAWNGTDRAGRRVPAGVYLLRLESETRSESVKIVVD